jgi:uncharacterized protein (TIGR02147 family)
MKNIFEYTNFREYLADFFEESKKTDPLFSHRYLASRIGLTTPNLIWLVIKGKRNLTESVCGRLIKYLRLTKRRANYFRAMVDFLQSKKHENKDRYFTRMIEMRKPFKVRKIDAQHYEYYTNWYNPVVRELVASSGFNGNFRELGLKVSPPVPEQQARNSVDLLLRLGMLRKKDGRYVQTAPVVSTGPEVKSLAVVNYHRQMSCLAASSYDRCNRDEHNISSVTMSMSRNKFQQLVRETNDYRRKVMALQDPGGNDTKVYQVNIQIFPVSRVPKKRRRIKRK